MPHLIYVLLAFAVAVEAKDGSLANERLSPPMIQKPASTKVEVPKLLADTSVVEEPAELLKTLRDTQQKAWGELKTVKVRAWYRFQNNKGPKPVTWLLEYSHSRNPTQFKELKFNSNRMMQAAKAGKKFDPVGVDADDRNAWYCLNGSSVHPTWSSSRRPRNICGQTTGSYLPFSHRTRRSHRASLKQRLAGSVLRCRRKNFTVWNYQE